MLNMSKGALQRKKSKNLSLLWKWVGGSRSHSEFFFFFLENHPKIALIPVLIFWSSIHDCVFCLYTLLKVFSYYDLSVLSMSVMGFQKKVCMGCELYSSLFWIFAIFLTLQSPLEAGYATQCYIHPVGVVISYLSGPCSSMYTVYLSGIYLQSTMSAIKFTLTTLNCMLSAHRTIIRTRRDKLQNV